MLRLLELIETLWNVNIIKNKYIFYHLLELIETLWNVNIPYISPDDFGNVELIETLWNVNFVARLKRPSLLSN